MAKSKIVPMVSEEIDIVEIMQRLNSGGGGSNSGGMEPRIAKLEARADGIEKRLDDIKGDIGRIETRLISLGDNQLTKWDVAQVVFIVVAALMAAAVFGPRLANFFAA